MRHLVLQHVRRRAGHRFWHAVKHLLGSIEMDLALWCVAEAGLPATALVLEDDEEEGLSDLDHSARRDPSSVEARTVDTTWGVLGDDKEGFYRACAARVLDMEWADVLRVCGPRVRLLGRIVASRAAGLQDPDLPARLRLGGFEVVGLDEESMRVVSYSPFDPLDLPRALVDLLHHFDGGEATGILTRVEAEIGEPVDPDLVRMLLDFDVLRAS